MLSLPKNYLLLVLNSKYIENWQVIIILTSLVFQSFLLWQEVYRYSIQCMFLRKDDFCTKKRFILILRIMFWNTHNFSRTYCSYINIYCLKCNSFVSCSTFLWITLKYDKLPVFRILAILIFFLFIILEVSWCSVMIRIVRFAFILQVIPRYCSKAVSQEGKA